MCKHNLLRAVFVAPPTIPVFLALLRGVEYRLQPFGKKAHDVRAAEVRVDIAEEFELVAETLPQDPIPETHFGGQQAIMKASQDAIGKVDGISKKLAEAIYAELHNID